MWWRQLLPTPRVCTLRQGRRLPAAERYQPVLRRSKTSAVPQVCRISALDRQQVRMSSDEVNKAQEAAAAGAGSESSIFTKIINKEIPSNIIHEDEKCIAFRDVNPVSPTHFLVVPRNPIPMLSKATDGDTELLGHLLQIARKVADTEKLEEGYRVVINNGKHGCQSVYHLHVHVMGGRQFNWPPG